MSSLWFLSSRNKSSKDHKSKELSQKVPLKPQTLPEPRQLAIQYSDLSTLGGSGVVAPLERGPAIGHGIGSDASNNGAHRRETDSSREEKEGQRQPEWSTGRLRSRLRRRPGEPSPLPKAPSGAAEADPSSADRINLESWSKILVELAQGTQKLASFKALFTALDRKGSGGIDVEELGVGLAERGVAITSTQLYLLFAELDRDRDGLISWPEFIRAATAALVSFKEKKHADASPVQVDRFPANRADTGEEAGRLSKPRRHTISVEAQSPLIAMPGASGDSSDDDDGVLYQPEAVVFNLSPRGGKDISLPRSFIAGSGFVEALPVTVRRKSAANAQAVVAAAAAAATATTGGNSTLKRWRGHYRCVHLGGVAYRSSCRWDDRAVGLPSVKFHDTVAPTAILGYDGAPLPWWSGGGEAEGGEAGEAREAEGGEEGWWLEVRALDSGGGGSEAVSSSHHDINGSSKEEGEARRLFLPIKLAKPADGLKAYFEPWLADAKDDVDPFATVRVSKVHSTPVSPDVPPVKKQPFLKRGTSAKRASSFARSASAKRNSSVKRSSSIKRLPFSPTSPPSQGSPKSVARTLPNTSPVTAKPNSTKGESPGKLTSDPAPPMSSIAEAREAQRPPLLRLPTATATITPPRRLSLIELRKAQRANVLAAQEAEAKKKNAGKGLGSSFRQRIDFQKRFSSSSSSSSLSSSSSSLVPSSRALASGEQRCLFQAAPVATSPLEQQQQKAGSLPQPALPQSPGSLLEGRRCRRTSSCEPMELGALELRLALSRGSRGTVAATEPTAVGKSSEPPETPVPLGRASPSSSTTASLPSTPPSSSPRQSSPPRSSGRTPPQTPPPLPAASPSWSPRGAPRGAPREPAVQPPPFPSASPTSSRSPRTSPGPAIQWAREPQPTRRNASVSPRTANGSSSRSREMAGSASRSRRLYVHGPSPSSSSSMSSRSREVAGSASRSRDGATPRGSPSPRGTGHFWGEAPQPSPTGMEAGATTAAAGALLVELLPRQELGVVLSDGGAVMSLARGKGGVVRGAGVQPGWRLCRVNGKLLGGAIKADALAKRLVPLRSGHKPYTLEFEPPTQVTTADRIRNVSEAATAALEAAGAAAAAAMEAAAAAATAAAVAVAVGAEEPPDPPPLTPPEDLGLLGGWDFGLLRPGTTM